MDDDQQPKLHDKDAYVEKQLIAYWIIPPEDSS